MYLQLQYLQPTKTTLTKGHSVLLFLDLFYTWVYGAMDINAQWKSLEWI